VSGRASRRPELGQRFLAGGRLAAELVEQAGVGAGDLVVEIGAGTGVLTEALARRAGRVVAVEVDPRLAARVQARLDALRRGLVPSLSRGQLRRLANDLGFPLDAGPADLDAAQWAGGVRLSRPTTAWEGGVRARRMWRNLTS
jgi:hypothetical protein